METYHRQKTVFILMVGPISPNDIKDMSLKKISGQKNLYYIQNDYGTSAINSKGKAFILRITDNPEGI